MKVDGYTVPTFQNFNGKRYRLAEVFFNSNEAGKYFEKWDHKPIEGLPGRPVGKISIKFKHVKTPNESLSCAYYRYDVRW